MVDSLNVFFLLRTSEIEKTFIFAMAQELEEGKEGMKPSSVGAVLRRGQHRLEHCVDDEDIDILLPRMTAAVDGRRSAPRPAFFSPVPVSVHGVAQLPMSPLPKCVRIPPIKQTQREKEIDIWYAWQWAALPAEFHCEDLEHKEDSNLPYKLLARAVRAAPHC